MIAPAVEPWQRSFPLRWRYLTAAQKRAVCNGCGGKGGWFDPPDYIFTASCNHHDLNYWLGGSEADRKKADRQFLTAMLADASAEPRFWRRWWYAAAARRYHLAVRLLGGKFFSYRSAPVTWDDLAEELRE